MLETLASLVVSLQRFIVPRQKLIISLLLVLLAGTVVMGIVLANLAISDPVSWLPVLGEVGESLGTISAILFCVTLLPGIAQRLRWFPTITLPLASIVTIFRRHLGILMFLTAWVHMAFTTSVPNVILTGSPFPPNGPRLFEFFGTMSWLLLMPVWLTSNDVSMRFLGRKWKTLQRLTYIANWLIFAHVALQGESLAVLLAVVAILEITSWVVQRRRTSVTPLTN